MTGDDTDDLIDELDRAELLERLATYSGRLRRMGAMPLVLDGDSRDMTTARLRRALRNTIDLYLDLWTATRVRP